LRLVVQRATSASVRVDGEVVGSIGPGLVVLVGVREGDTPEAARRLADKVANLRIFGDDEGRMNRSVLEASGSCLVVSQFTLYGDTRRGRRPSFVEAARPEVAEPLIGVFVGALAALGVEVAEGVFRAHMEVSLVNDGPVTIVMESDPGA
jgi:D-tyrosyl-tRNA(Tyr) deacylase